MSEQLFGEGTTAPDEAFRQAGNVESAVQVQVQVEMLGSFWTSVQSGGGAAGAGSAPKRPPSNTVTIKNRYIFFIVCFLKLRLKKSLIKTYFWNTFTLGCTSEA
jgi:hypothetical protein